MPDFTAKNLEPQFLPLTVDFILKYKNTQTQQLTLI